MHSEQPAIRLLSDEHYPGWLADELTADGIDTVALNIHRPGLRGVVAAMGIRVTAGCWGNVDWSNWVYVI